MGRHEVKEKGLSVWDAHLVQGRLELRPLHVGMWLPFNDHDPRIRVGTRVRCVVGDKLWWDTRVRAIGRVGGVIRVIDLYDKGMGILSYHPDHKDAWDSFVQFELTWGDK